MRLRFVTCSDIESEAIRLREGEMAVHIGFTPSHVEMVVAEGYLGAHADGGVQIRPIGYDKATMVAELFVDVPLAAEGDAAAEKYARSKIGIPYDWQAILDFVMDTNFHAEGHVICSAFCDLVADNGGAFPYPLALAAHQVTPRDLLFWFSGRVAINKTP